MNTHTPMRFLSLLLLAGGLGLSACGDEAENNSNGTSNNATNTLVTNTDDTTQTVSTGQTAETGETGDTTLTSSTGGDDTTMTGSTGNATATLDTNTMGTLTMDTNTVGSMTTGTTTMGTMTGTELMCPGDLRDTDSDGLSDCDELALGTDPRKVDTDGDTLTDYEEVQLMTDPLAKDSDGDGLDDEDELRFGFNPGNPSTFGNGVFDGDLFIVTACDVPESEPAIFKESSRGDWLVALPVAFSNYTELAVTTAGAQDALAVYDDPVNEVSGFIFSKKATGQSAIRALVDDYKPGIASVSTILQDFTQGEFETHDKNQAAPGEYRVSVSNKSVNQLRNELLFKFSKFTPADVTNLPAAAGNKYATYYMQVTVIERADRIITTVAIAPNQYYEQFDAVKFRMNDLINTTGITKAGDDRKLRCYPFPASTEVPSADFYWVLDQSGSMFDDYVKVKSFATDFYNRLENTSLDFRLGVTNMDSVYKGRLRTGGPLWHDDPNTFIKEIEDYVSDCVVPCNGGLEHGLYNAREGIKYMKSTAAAPNERFRPAAQIATIWMSDEQDQSVKDGRDPGGMTTPAATLTKAYENFFAMNPLAFAIVSPGSPCGFEASAAYEAAALASGGATASLCATDLQETINQIIDIVTGRASTYLMPQTPISSTLRVYQGDEQGINSIWVPRSRKEGFDYFPQTNSLAFFGTFRPKASTRTVCNAATACMTPGESCKDNACTLDISAQIVVHYRYFRRLDKPQVTP